MARAWNLRFFGLLAALTAAALSASCASAPKQVRTFAFLATGPGAPHPSGVIMSYPQALAAILWVMENRLDFPPFSGSLELHPSHSSMVLGLEGEGYDPSYAVQIADQLDGVTRQGHIIANDAVLRWQHWPARTAFLAHEMTHVAEYALANGRRGSSGQWLREGLAEWVSWRVVDDLKLGSYRARKHAALLRLCEASHRKALPPFSEVVTQSAWERNGKRHSLDPLYDQAFLATELLVELHGLPAVLDYFHRFARSDDSLANFRAAFGEERQHFEATFQVHLRHLLK
jgi:hypothetical protein